MERRRNNDIVNFKECVEIMGIMQGVECDGGRGVGEMNMKR
jgi:hypothetical protein